MLVFCKKDNTLVIMYSVVTLICLLCRLILVVCVTLDPGSTYDEHLVLALKLCVIEQHMIRPLMEQESLCCRAQLSWGRRKATPSGRAIHAKVMDTKGFPSLWSSTELGRKKQKPPHRAWDLVVHHLELISIVESVGALVAT
jgi:hypothetical protein